MFLCEDHIHVMVNNASMNQWDNIVCCEEVKSDLPRVRMLLYARGWAPQQEI